MSKQNKEKWKPVPLSHWVSPDPKVKSFPLFYEVSDRGKFRRLNTRTQKWVEVKVVKDFITIRLGTIEGVDVYTRINIKNIYWKCFNKELKL